MDAYNTSIKILTETVEVDVPPEIFNNMGSLQYRMGNYVESMVSRASFLSENFEKNVIFENYSETFYDGDATLRVRNAKRRRRSVL